MTENEATIKVEWDPEPSLTLHATLPEDKKKGDEITITLPSFRLLDMLERAGFTIGRKIR